MTITTFLVDLDDTVYPSSSGIWELIGERINQYLHQKMGVPWDEVTNLRQSLLMKYGTTLRGLQMLHGVDARDYLAFVHAVPVSEHLSPDPHLAAVLGRYPQRKLIFTNADSNHARNVLSALQIEQHFAGIIDILAVAPFCKPMPEAFERALEQAAVDPHECMMFDDAPRNLETARRLGCQTVLVGGSAQPGRADVQIARLADLPTVFPPPG